MLGGLMVLLQLCCDVLEMFGVLIQIVYGQIEILLVLMQVWYEDMEVDFIQIIGQLVVYIEILIWDLQNNVVLLIGMQGEICVCVYSVMLGYNDNLDVIVVMIDIEGWLYIGDFGIMDVCGYVKIIGCVKEMIICGGENLFLVEIENVMLEYDVIDEVVVVGVVDEKWGEQVVCFICSEFDYLFSLGELKVFV